MRLYIGMTKRSQPCQNDAQCFLCSVPSWQTRKFRIRTRVKRQTCRGVSFQNEDDFDVPQLQSIFKTPYRRNFGASPQLLNAASNGAGNAEFELCEAFVRRVHQRHTGTCNFYYITVHKDLKLKFKSWLFLLFFTLKHN